MIAGLDLQPRCRMISSKNPPKYRHRARVSTNASAVNQHALVPGAMNSVQHPDCTSSPTLPGFVSTDVLDAQLCYSRSIRSASQDCNPSRPVPEPAPTPAQKIDICPVKPTMTRAHT